MRAYVITLDGHEYSEAVAARCIKTAAEVGGVEVARFRAVGKADSESVMLGRGLRWTWGPGCPKTGLRHHPYGGDLRALIGCAMSHLLLWEKCGELDEPILILEHDSVFLREFPVFDFDGICQINDPAGATRRGQWWSEHMRQRGTDGAHEKTWVTSAVERNIPDGLAGNSAYAIKPFAAIELIEKVRELGVWPNDAIMCKQLFPYLQEYYPFITRVEQAVSTSSA